MSKADKKIIDSFFETEREIWKLVGEDEVQYQGVTDGRECSYYLDENEILYRWPDAENNDNYYGGEIYGTAIFRGKKYTIAVYDNGCGDRKCPILLTNSKAVERDEFEA